MFVLYLGFLTGQTVKNCLQCERLGFNPWVGKIPWRRTWQPTPVFLPGESPGSLVSYNPWVCPTTLLHSYQFFHRIFWSLMQPIKYASDKNNFASFFPIFTFFFGIFLILLVYDNCMHVCDVASVVSNYALQPARLLCPWDSPGGNPEMGCHTLLPGIFPTQGLNMSPTSHTLAGGFFTISTIWETIMINYAESKQ